MHNYQNELLTKVAWYYYKENMTQNDIALELGISRTKVVKLLESARQNGVIQFKISKDESNKLIIEKKLKEKYNLSDVYVIPAPYNEATINESLAKAAASYIDDRITNNTFINMGYGDTPSRVLNHLAAITDVPISIVSLTGGVNYYLPNTQSNIFKAKLYLYPTPLLFSTKEACASISDEPSVKEINRMINLASYSIVGIGAMDENATIIKNGILNKSDFTYLFMKGAVGDILTHFIDKNGDPIHTSIEERLISTPLYVLKELHNVIGIAGGHKKVNVIHAALRGGYIDILITDENTAKTLLNI